MEDNLIPPEKLEEYLNDEKKFKLFVIQTLQRHNITLSQLNRQMKYLILIIIIILSIVLGIDCNKIINFIQLLK